MRPSGAAVDAWKIQAVIDYLNAEFPAHEVNHVPKGDQIADLFQVIGSSKALHQLLVRRTFFDRYNEPKLWPDALTHARAAERMKKAGPEVVELD